VGQLTCHVLDQTEANAAYGVFQANRTIAQMETDVRPYLRTSGSLGQVTNNPAGPIGVFNIRCHPDQQPYPGLIPVPQGTYTWNLPRYTIPRSRPVTEQEIEEWVGDSATPPPGRR
jgi:hypothetical protein